MPLSSKRAHSLYSILNSKLPAKHLVFQQLISCKFGSNSSFKDVLNHVFCQEKKFKLLLISQHHAELQTRALHHTILTKCGHLVRIVYFRLQVLLQFHYGFVLSKCQGRSHMTYG